MKTAEEWLVEMGIDIDTGPVPPQTQLIMSAAIRKIQLDAWKQGMTHAALLIAGGTNRDSNLILRERDRVEDLE